MSKYCNYPGCQLKNATCRAWWGLINSLGSSSILPDLLVNLVFAVCSVPSHLLAPELNMTPVVHSHFTYTRMIFNGLRTILSCKYFFFKFQNKMYIFKVWINIFVVRSNVLETINFQVSFALVSWTVRETSTTFLPSPALFSFLFFSYFNRLSSLTALSLSMLTNHGNNTISHIYIWTLVYRRSKLWYNFSMSTVSILYCLLS